MMGTSVTERHHIIITQPAAESKGTYFAVHIIMCGGDCLVIVTITEQE